MPTSGIGAGRGATGPELGIAATLAGRLVRFVPGLRGALLDRFRAGFAFRPAPFVGAPLVAALAVFG
ncbi:MAG: hypothetical protein OEM16_09215, partial [Myxococcales bacterium]|nr:hypothetical protein [Myxococcales bacterium]